MERKEFHPKNIYHFFRLAKQNDDFQNLSEAEELEIRRKTEKHQQENLNQDESAKTNIDQRDMTKLLKKRCPLILAPKKIKYCKSLDPRRDDSNLEERKNGIAEFLIKVNLDFHSLEFTKDLENYKQSLPSKKLYMKVLSLYPYKEPIPISEYESFLYHIFLADKVFTDKESKEFTKFLQSLEIDKNFYEQILSSEIMKKLADKFELAILWVIKRFEKYKKAFCYSKRNIVEKDLVKRILIANQKISDSWMSKGQQQEFTNDDGDVIKKTWSGRMILYENLTQIEN